MAILLSYIRFILAILSHRLSSMKDLDINARNIRHKTGNFSAIVGTYDSFGQIK